MADSYRIDPSGFYVERGDVRLFVTDSGGDLPVVVLLHGLAGSSREWKATANALQPDFRVVCIDQRGHGASTRRPTDLSRAAFVDDVIAVMEQVSPNQRAHLVGQSMGAHTAFLVSDERPDLVDRLVMLEGHVQGDNDPRAAAKIGDFSRRGQSLSQTPHRQLNLSEIQLCTLRGSTTSN